ncbi:MAG: YraN family protein [Candidatus Cloacimonetes bacterium]|nr:YraN family protein [Candidatus Cloacimonadota bacterium]
MGRSGENSAASYLISQNFKILQQNYHSASGEIDLIALENDTLVFVEVKTRHTDLERALGSVSLSKQRKIVKAALHYLSRHQQYADHFTRFDVIVVLRGKSSENSKIHHLRDAFTPGMIPGI